MSRNTNEYSSWFPSTLIAHAVSTLQFSSGQNSMITAEWRGSDFLIHALDSREQNCHQPEAGSKEYLKSEERWYRVQERDTIVAMQRITPDEEFMWEDRYS